MKRLLIAAGCIAVLASALPAGAEFQNMMVGGSVRIRGNWYSSEATGDSLTGRTTDWESPRRLACGIDDRLLHELGDPGRYFQQNFLQPIGSLFQRLPYLLDPLRADWIVLFGCL